MSSHVFAIAGHGDSPYLDECVDSLVRQTVPSRIVLCAGGRRSEFLSAVARRHQIEFVHNPAGGGIAVDWNFALTTTSADRVTVVHQDDVYATGYASAIKLAFDATPDASIAFTDHTEHDPFGPRAPNLNVRVKRWLCHRAFSDRLVLRAENSRLRLLRFGNPICCPSVTFNRRVIPQFRFSSRFEINLDWDAWARLASLTGPFIYIPDPLVSHRVHSGTETSAGIQDRRRQIEDAAMFRRFWPAATARLISTVYRLSYLGNRTGEDG